MKARGIIFSAPMVLALQEGRKTQTRRVVNPQPDEDVGAIVCGIYSPGIEDRNGDLEPGEEIFGAYSECGEWGAKCRYGMPGELLYVRETWARYNIDQDRHDIAYRATPPADWPADGRWRPAIHMPRTASRITLRLADVRVERLQSISKEDAEAEGVENVTIPGHGDARGRIRGCWKVYTNPELGTFSPIDSYRSLWESLHGEGSWARNDWVWRLEFECIRKNVDEVLRDG